MTPRLLFLLALAALSSCSRYPSEFESAVRTYQKTSASPTTPVGPWKGTWQSESNGHHGPLWCLITADPDHPQQWNFRYRAGWGLLKFGDYTHPVKASLSRTGNLALDHQMILPNNLGTYRVMGTVTPKQFSVRYKSQGDHGTMVLTRP